MWQKMMRNYINRKTSNRAARRGKTGALTGQESRIIQLINQQLRVSRPLPEVKTFSCGSAAQNIGAYNSSAFSGSGVALSPYTGFCAIVQGTGQGARLGNRIEIKKVRFRGSIKERAYNVTTNPTPIPQYVRMLVLTDVDNYNTFPLPGNDFFQFGSSSTVPDGTMNDIFADVNKDRWTVYHDQVFKVGYAVAGGTGVQVGSQSFSNNDFLLSADFDIDVTKYMPKMYDFDDNSSQPKTKCVSVYFFSVPYDGFVTSSAVIPCNLAYHLTVDFTDA